MDQGLDGQVVAEGSVESDEAVVNVAIVDEVDLCDRSGSDEVGARNARSK